MNGPSGRRLIAFTHGRRDPASRFRIEQFIPHLERSGWTVSLRPRRPARPWETPYTSPRLRGLHRRARTRIRRLRRQWDIRAASRFDVVFLNRDLLEGRVVYEERLFRRNPRVVFDFDDAIYLDGKEDHIRWICENAAWVTAGNETLAAFARACTDKVSVLPTVVDTDAYRVSRGARQAGPVRVGWLGSDQSIRETLFPHLDMIERLQADLGFDFIVVSRPWRALPCKRLRWKFVEWSPVVETRTAELFDIGIMPLVDDPYQHGKCGCKLLQYMAAGLPAVASPIGINARLLGEGRGVLAATEHEWREALAALSADADLRRALGDAGRAFVEREYSLDAWFPLLRDILERVADARRSPSG